MAAIVRRVLYASILVSYLCSEYTQAASDRSRTRSPIRSIPIAADIKKDLDFDCPEEFGYYPHPSDCSQYYVCVFGGALLESCTGGLMYSHELQTCDWPRNVGCDPTGVSSVTPATIESPRRQPIQQTPASPTPVTYSQQSARAQPNPIVTSRGQPKLTRQEIVKQQQLYEEVEELPPAEEIESDRQQRVYRGQPSTIGQVQRDRDGYGAQLSGRNINANIIPTSIDGGKVGAFSFGTQVDQQRKQQEQQSYNKITKDLTDKVYYDIQRNNSDGTENAIDKRRKKRQTTYPEQGTEEHGMSESETDKQSDIEQESIDANQDDLEKIEDDEEEENENDEMSNESERGKRQIRHRYISNVGFNDYKPWPTAKPFKTNYFQLGSHGLRYSHPHYNHNAPKARFHEENNRGYPDDSVFPTPNPHFQYSTIQNLIFGDQKRFKASNLDPYSSQVSYNPLNTFTQIITKSPPISSLYNNKNPFSSLAGGFYNNAPQKNVQILQQNVQENQNQNRQIQYQNYQNENVHKHVDSSDVPSDFVTEKPVFFQTKENQKYRTQPEDIKANQNRNSFNRNVDSKPLETVSSEKNEGGLEFEEESVNESDHVGRGHTYSFPQEFSGPKLKFSNIENPFVDPNFDFSKFIDKLKETSNNGVKQGRVIQPYSKQNNAVEVIPSIEYATLPTKFTKLPDKDNIEQKDSNYGGMSTPRPFSFPTKTIVSWPPKFSSESTTKATFEKAHTIQEQPRTQTPPSVVQQLPKYTNSTNHNQNHGVKTQVANEQVFLPVSLNYVPAMKLKPPRLINAVSLRPYITLVTNSPPVIYNTNPKVTLPIDASTFVTEKPLTYSIPQIYVSKENPTTKSAQKPYSTMSIQYVQSTKASTSVTKPTVKETTLRPTIPSRTIKPRQDSKENTKVTPTPVAPKRRPIPKPSPEMADYYYDEDEEYYYEPPVKSQYMPSSEIRPQRPPIAQNDEEYDDDSYEDEEDDDEVPYNQRLKNHQINQSGTPGDNKIAIPVMMNFVYANQKDKYQSINTTKYHNSGPFTRKPPKYLNQTTLRPYTVRHRLAKPTSMHATTSKPTTAMKPNRGNNKWSRPKENSLRPTKLRENMNHDTRFTKTRHDGKINSIEPTESVTPPSFSQRPRPTPTRNVYNNSQNFNQEQFDSFYSLYDEDSELYKDNDYVQQFNYASERPLVQQTYRGTPPSPVSSTRRPVAQDIYTPRPINPDDYDEELIQGQIDDQSDYRPPLRQSTRGDRNEINYDHNPDDDIRTTVYEGTSKRTTFTTTSTSTTTTTQSPITAPITEAMTPSRYTPRSTTESLSRSSDETTVKSYSFSIPSSPQTSPQSLDLTVNISALAKPFQLTSNSPKPLQIQYYKRSNVSDTTMTRPSTDKLIDKKPLIFSLFSGFSIRHNANNTENPYTLTVMNTNQPSFKSQISYDTSRRNQRDETTSTSQAFNRRSDGDVEYLNTFTDSTENSNSVSQVERLTPRLHEFSNDSLNKSALLSELNHRLYLKTVIKRPAPFKFTKNDSTTKTNLIIITDKSFENSSPEETSSSARSDITDVNNQLSAYTNEKKIEKQPYISPYDTLDRLRSKTSSSYKKNLFRFPGIVKSTVSPFVPTFKNNSQDFMRFDRFVDNSPSSPLIDAITELLEVVTNSTLKDDSQNIDISTTTQTSKEEPRYLPLTINRFDSEEVNNTRFSKINIEDIYITTTESLKELEEDSVEDNSNLVSSSTLEPMTEDLIQDNTDKLGPLAYILEKENDRTISVEPTKNEDNRNSVDNPSSIKPELTTDKTNEIFNFIDFKKDQTKTTIPFSTTGKTTITTPFPTRASRVNPAIKLAATLLGTGRRINQSSPNCTDNSLHQNPKCNEINILRTGNRGRGTAHYSTSSGGDVTPVNVNRGTPPTRLRPTLKPSTAIVSKAVEFVDIYQYPPSRPDALYPQPIPDKTAAKCRKDVCLLPDCYCGGKDIPGDLPVESVPQMVLLTFDDSVNDLNKGLYTDLFEKGRVNPNGCPLSATFYVSHEWTDYSQVQNLYAAGHEMASHTISHSFGEQFSQKKWNREVSGQREILSAYGGVKLEDVRGMRAPFLSVGGNKMFKMLYDSNFTYDSSMPVYENRPPSWPYTLDYKIFHDCMIPPCPTRSYPGVWEVPMVMWQDLNGGRCSMGDACANPPTAEGVYKMLLKNFDRHYTTNRAPFGLFYHAAWFTQPHHKEGFIMFMDFVNQMNDVFFVTNWQALQWVRNPVPLSRINNFQPFQCNYPDRPKRCNNPKVCNLWHKSGVRYMRTCQPCPDVYPWTGKTGIRSSRIDNEIEES